MRTMHRLLRVLVIAGALLSVLPASFGAAARAEEADATRATMQVIFDNVRTLLTFAVEEGGFRDPAHERQIIDALNELGDQAAMLSEHAGAGDVGSAFLASALERYALLVLRNYEWGRVGRLRPLIYRTTEICIACHTRLPSPGDSPVAGDFIDSQTVRALPPYERAKVEVATRRFDDALVTLEALLASPTMAPRELVDVTRTYLWVNLRVKRDFERPLPVLERLTQRPGLPTALRRDVGQWVEDLRRLHAHPPAGSGLQAARTLVEAAQRFADPRGGLVDYVAASGLLHRYLEEETAQVGRDQRAAAYYLLGVTEYRSHADDWLPQAELYLEYAVRMAPQSPAAARAYDLLAAKVMSAYGAASPDALPEGIRDHLRKLRALMEPSGLRRDSAPKGPRMGS
jgi:hypothetical protein